MTDTVPQDRHVRNRASRSPRTTGTSPTTAILAGMLLLLAGLSTSSRAQSSLPAERPSDDQITRTVRARIAETTGLEAPGNAAGEIDVESSDGIVTLTGTVDNLLVERRIKRSTSQVRGVRAIIDRIEVAESDRSEATVEALVREALAQDPVVGPWGIEATVRSGTVTLSGEVDTWRQQEEAGDVAGGVAGVREVENEITIQRDTAESDVTIGEDTRRALKWDARIDRALIEVDTSGRAIHLSGTVGSLYQKNLAVSAARSAGATEVRAQDLTVEPWAYDAPNRKETLVAISDAQIRRAAQEALLLDPRTQPFTIRVEVDRGRVTLTGSVHSLEAKRSAEENARYTTGVWRVVNEIEVRPSEPITDETIGREIRRALLRDPIVTGSTVDVRVDDGRAVLAGTVESEPARSRAEEVAARVGGVARIDVRLTVREGT